MSQRERLVNGGVKTLDYAEACCEMQYQHEQEGDVRSRYIDYYMIYMNVRRKERHSHDIVQSITYLRDRLEIQLSMMADGDAFIDIDRRHHHPWVVMQRKISVVGSKQKNRHPLMARKRGSMRQP